MNALNFNEHFWMEDNVIDTFTRILYSSDVKFTNNNNRTSQLYLPVSIDSFRIQLPVSRTASQCITQPCAGISKTSPGTKRSVDMTSVLRIKSPLSSTAFFGHFLKTVHTSELCTVDFKFRSFYKNNYNNKKIII